MYVACKEALQRKPQQGSVGEGEKGELLFSSISNPLTATCKINVRAVMGKKFLTPILCTSRIMFCYRGLKTLDSGSKK